MSGAGTNRFRQSGGGGTGESTRKSERTRTQILEGARAFLWSSPFREMTVSTLMAGVDVSRPAFYQYFDDLHELMGELLRSLREELLHATQPWFTSDGDPLDGLTESLSAMTHVAFRRGPFIRAVADAATTDERLERTWFTFLEEFDEAVAARIAEHQSQGWTPDLDARAVAVSLNRLNLSMIIYAFGRRPRSKPDRVREALTRIWASTLYPHAPFGAGGEGQGRDDST